MARHMTQSLVQTWDRWFSRLALIAGLWMVVSPWALGIGIATAAAFSAISCGLVIVAISMAMIVWQQRLSRQGIFVLGLIVAVIASIAMAAPFIFGFEGLARWSAIFAGVLVVVDIGYELLHLRV